MKRIQRKYLLSDFLIITAFWEAHLSKPMQYFFLFGSNLQCLLVLVWFRCVLITNNSKESLSEFLKRLCEITMLDNFITQNIEDSVFGAFLTVLLIYCLTIVIIIALLFSYYLYGKEQHLPTRTQRLITYFGQFHLAIGFWLTKASLFDCSHDSDLQRIIINRLNIPYLLIVFCSIVLSIISIGFACFLALFSYDPFLNMNILSCHSPSFQLITFIFKAGAAPILILLEDSQHKNWMFTSFSLIVMSVRHYNLFKTFPFYEYRVMKIAITLSSVCLMTSFFNLVGLALNLEHAFSFENFFVEEIILSLLANKFWQNYFDLLVSKNLERLPSDIKTQESVLKKVFSLRHFMDGSIKLSSQNMLTGSNELKYWGLIHSYNEPFEKVLETASEASEGYEKNIFESLTIKQFQSYLFKVRKQAIHKLLEDFSKKSIENNKLKILLISKCIESQENIQICIIYLLHLSKAKGIDRIIASKLSRNIQEHIYTLFNANKEVSLDVISHIEFEATSEKLTKLVYSSSQKQIAFWTTYEDNIILLKDFYQKCNKIEEEHTVIKSYWKNNVEKHDAFVSFLVPLYSLYMCLVKHRPAKAAKIFKRAGLKYQKEATRDQSKLVSEEVINDENTLTFHTSMSKERLGIIIRVSPHISEVVGWHQQELVGKNINAMIPLFIKEGHDQALQNYLKQIENPLNPTKIDKSFKTFLVDRAGYVLPCHVFISLHPDIQNELVYIAIVKVTKPKEDYIMFNNDGYISGFSEKIGKRLDLASERELHIEEVCQNYSVLQRAFVNNRKLAGKKENSQRRLEKTARSYRIGSVFDTGKLSVSENHGIFPKVSLQTHLTLDLINRRTSKKGSNVKVYQYSTELKQDTALSLSFYILKMTPIVTETIIDFEDVFKSPRHKSGKTEEVEVPDELQIKGKSTYFTGMSLNTNNIISIETESERKMLYLSSPKRLKSLVKKHEGNKEKNFTSGNRKKDKVPSLNGLQKDEDNRRVETILGMLNKECEDTASSMSSERHNVRIEKAVHKIPQTHQLLRLNRMIILFVLISSALLLGYQIQNNKVLVLLEGNLEVLSQTGRMLNQVVTIHREVRFMLLADLHMVTPPRYNNSETLSEMLDEVSDIRSIFAAPVMDSAITMNILNNNIKNSLYKIEPDLQSLLFESKIPVFEYIQDEGVRETRKAKLFDLTNDIVAQTINLANKVGRNMTPDIANYYFVLNNTMNDYLVAGEKIIPILIEESHLNLQDQLTLIAVMLGLIILFSLYLCNRFYKIIRDFVKRRKHFIDIFKRLEDEHLIINIVQVKKFASMLEKNNFSSKGLQLKINNHLLLQPTHAIENSKLRKKVVNMKDINNTWLKVSFLAVFYILSLLVTMITTLVLANFQAKSIANEIELMMLSNYYLYELNLLSAIQYEYIQDNATTNVRNMPIKEEYELIYASLTKAHDFFILDLLDKDKGLGSDQDLIDIIQGNICDKLQKQSTRSDLQCSQIKGGILKSGIIGLNSLILSLITTTISSFENSARSLGDMFEILNSEDVVFGEGVFMMYGESANSLVVTVIETHLKNNFNYFRQTFAILVIINAVWGLVSGMLIWNKISKSLEKEIIQWGKMIRQIPLDIITHNKLFKGYLKEVDQKAEN